MNNYSPWILVISCTALFLSGMTFYFSHIRRARDLRAVVIDAGWLPDSHELFVDIIYLNGGTEPEVVVGAALRFFYSSDPPGHGLLDLTDGTPFAVKADPLVIAPESKSIKRYKFALMAEKLKSAQLRCSAAPPFVSIESKIRFKVMDPEGFSYEVNLAKGSSSQPGCPVRFAFVLDEVFPLERRISHDLQLMVAKERYRGFRSTCTSFVRRMRLKRQLRKLPPVKYS